MIKQLDTSYFPLAADLIRTSFATVAKEFGLTQQNFPTHTSFVATTERLQNHFAWGWLMYGYFDDEQLIGYVSVSKEAGDTYEIHNLAVLPEYRCKGTGRQLLDYCKAKVRELDGAKIALSIIEENTVLKNWYIANGFVHIGTKKFEQLPITVGYMEFVV